MFFYLAYFGQSGHQMGTQEDSAVFSSHRLGVPQAPYKLLTFTQQLKMVLVFTLNKMNPICRIIR